MKELFTNPNKFFQEHHGEVPATPPVVFVGLAGLLYSLASLIPLSPLFESITGAEQAIALIPAALGIALGTSMFYVIWFLLSSFVYFTTKRFDGEGSFGELMLTVGWSFLPLVVAAGTTLVALLVVLNEAPTPSDPEDFERVQDLLETSSLIDLNLSLMILFYFWQGMLLTFDIEHTRGVTCREAAIVASIPVITSVGWSISRLV